MDKDSIEYLLSNYFNDIIWITESSVKFTISETSKVNGKIQTSSKEEIYELKELLVSSLEEINNSLFLEINQCLQVDLNYYPKNICSKIFKINSDKQLKKELSTLSSNNWIITSNKLYNTLFVGLDYNVYLSDEFDDKIVIGDKNSKLLLNQNLKEFYLDKSKIKVLNLK